MRGGIAVQYTFRLFRPSAGVVNTAGPSGAVRLTMTLLIKMTDAWRPVPCDVLPAESETGGDPRFESLDEALIGLLAVFNTQVHSIRVSVKPGSIRKCTVSPPEHSIIVEPRTASLYITHGGGGRWVWRVMNTLTVVTLEQLFEAIDEEKQLLHADSSHVVTPGFGDASATAILGASTMPTTGEA